MTFIAETYCSWLLIDDVVLRFDLHLFYLVVIASSYFKHLYLLLKKPSVQMIIKRSSPQCWPPYVEAKDKREAYFVVLRLISIRPVNVRIMCFPHQPLGDRRNLNM